MKRRASTSGGLISAICLIALVGCVKQVPRPVVIRDADETERRKIFEQYRLKVKTNSLPALPYLRLESPRFVRDAGTTGGKSFIYVLNAYEEPRELLAMQRSRVIGLMGIGVVGILGVPAVLEGVNPLLSFLCFLDGGGVFFQGRTSLPYELADAYNRGLARDLALTVSESGYDIEAINADFRWRGGRVVLSCDIGMAGKTLDDVSDLYVHGIDWESKKMQAQTLFGLAADFTISEHFQIGMCYEPRLCKKATVEYRDGSEDRWTLDAMGVLGRLRIIFPLVPGFSLSGTLGGGRYDLSGAQYDGNYWISKTCLTGNTVGGTAAVGAERLLSRHAAIGVDLGYRLIRFKKVKAWDDRYLINADGSRAVIDHSGPFIQTWWRYYL